MALATTPDATLKIGTASFASSNEPLVPSADGGGEPIVMPTIRKPAGGEKPKPAPVAAPKIDGEGPVGGDVSDDELLEAARRAANRNKKKPDGEVVQHHEDDHEGKTAEEIEAERVAEEQRQQQQQRPKPGDKETNLGNLRKMLEARDTEIAAIKAERDALLPLKEKENTFSAWETEKTKLAEEVQKLSPFRDLFAIRENPVFQQAYVVPVNEAKDELAKLAKDYKASDEDVAALLEAKDKKAVNDKLAEMFGDDSIPIGEARTHLAKIAKVEAQRIEAEKKPTETLSQLQAAQQQAEVARGQKVVAEAEESRKVGWNTALQINTKKEFEVEAFVEIPGNKEHNDRRAAVLTDAQKLHAQTVGLIVKHGGRVSPQIASFLATQAQLATVAQVYEKDAAYWRAEHDKLLAKTGQQRQQERPGATTSPRSAPVKQAPTKLSGREAAKNIWQQVMAEGE